MYQRARALPAEGVCVQSQKAHSSGEEAVSEAWGMSSPGEEGTSERRRSRGGAEGRWCVPWGARGLWGRGCWDKAPALENDVLVGGKRGVTANGYQISLWGEEHVLNLIAMVAQLRDYTRNHQIA